MASSEASPSFHVQEIEHLFSLIKKEELFYFLKFLNYLCGIPDNQH